MITRTSCSFRMLTTLVDVKLVRHDFYMFWFLDHVSHKDTTKGAHSILMTLHGTLQGDKPSFNHKNQLFACERWQLTFLKHHSLNLLFFKLCKYKYICSHTLNHIVLNYARIIMKIMINFVGIIYFFIFFWKGSLYVLKGSSWLQNCNIIAITKGSTLWSRHNFFVEYYISTCYVYYQSKMLWLHPCGLL